MVILQAETYDELQKEVLGRLEYEPEFVSGVKGSMTKEVLSATLHLYDPRARITSSPVRAMDYGPLIGRLLTGFQGEDDGKHDELIKKLMANPSARDAVLVTGAGAMQFMIRNGRLFLHQTLTEADAVWSLTEHVFLSTLVQELALLELTETYPALELGSYTLTVGSLYLLERHFELAAVLQREEGRSPARMLPIRKREDLYALARDEKALRERSLVGVGGYTGGAAWMFDQLLTFRMNRDAELRWPQLEMRAAA